MPDSASVFENTENNLRTCIATFGEDSEQVRITALAMCKALGRPEADWRSIVERYQNRRD